MKIFTTEDIRAIDKATIENEGISSRQLIERVAEGVAAEVMRRWRPTKRIAVYAGPGNNGADALAASRILVENGYRPDVVLFNIGGNRLSADCRQCRDDLLSVAPSINFTEVVNKMTIPDINSSWIVIDGLFGSGLKEPLSGGFTMLARHINESRATVVSIDIPSGLFCEWNVNNLERNMIHASLTLSVQFPKLSFLLSDNANVVGRWQLLEIGLSEEAIRSTRSNYHLVDGADVARVLRRRPEFCAKSDFGSALIVAGSYGMMGAAVLAAKGALRAGVGKLAVHSPRCGYTTLQTAVPDALFNADKQDIFISDIRPYSHYTSIAVGPGLGTSDITINALETFLKSVGRSVVLDADALNCIAKRPALLNHIPALSVITPHAAEFDRLFGKQPNAETRLLKAIQMSRHYNIIIVLKGHYSAICRPDGKVYFNSTGSPALATAGSGDVLTGIIVALLAQSYKPEIAAAMAVYIHGLAGELAEEIHGQWGVTASDIASNVGVAIKQIMG